MTNNNSITPKANNRQCSCTKDIPCCLFSFFFEIGVLDVCLGSKGQLKLSGK